MAFAVKYRMGWTDIGNQEDTYRIDVETDGYAGSIIELGHTMDGFSLNYEERDWIQGFEGVFSFHLEDVNTDDYDADFFDSQYKQFKVKFYINDVVKNVGWLKPENTTRTILGPYVEYKISFTDALADLDNIDYDGFEDAGFQPILQIIKNALSFVDIDDFDFFIQCGLYENQLMTSSENLFKQLQFNNSAFYDIQEGKTTPDKCSEVIEKCVKPFYCRFNQSDGYWKITNGQEYISPRDIYAYSNLAAVSENIENNRTVNIFDFHVAGGKLELTKIPPIRFLKTIWRNKKLGTSELANPHFSSGTTGWNNGTGTEAWTSAPFVSNGKLVLAENSGTGNPNTNKKITSDPFTISDIGDGKGVFHLSFKLNLKTATYTIGEYYTSPPFYKVSLKYPNGDIVSQGERIIVQGESTYELSVTHIWPVNAAGNYEFIFEYIVNPNNAIGMAELSILELELDDVILTHNAVEAGETTDMEFHYTEAGAPGYQTIEEEIYFNDGGQLSDAGVIVDLDGETLTSSWSRYGFDTETKTLVQTFSEQYLNDRQGYFNQITLQGLVDLFEEINFNSIILYKSKKYRFIQFSKNYLNKQIDGILQQVENGVVLGISQIIKSRFSQWGINFKDLVKGTLPGHGSDISQLLSSAGITFGGSIGLGGKNPRAYLHLPKASGLQFGAPLKFEKAPTSGRLETPEEGAVEFYTDENGIDRLTMTINNVRYEMTNRDFIETIDTSGSLISFDVNNQTSKYYKASHPIQQNNTWEFLNDSSFVTGKFRFIAGGFVDYFMPPNVSMSDSRFNEDTKAWRPNDLGEYEARFFKDPSGYMIEIYGPYLSGNKAPQIFNLVAQYSGGLLSATRTYFDAEGDLENNPLCEASNVAITGLSEIGSVLTLDYDFFSPSGYTEGTPIIQWYRKDPDTLVVEEITGADELTYTTVTADIDKLIYAVLIVTQTATAPANGNPNSIAYTSNEILCTEESVLPVMDLTLYYDHVLDAKDYDGVNFEVPDTGLESKGTPWSSPAAGNRPTYSGVDDSLTFDPTTNVQYMEGPVIGSATKAVGDSRTWEMIGVFEIPDVTAVNGSEYSIFSLLSNLFMRAQGTELETASSLTILFNPPLTANKKWKFRLRSESNGTLVTLRLQLNYDEDLDSYEFDQSIQLGNNGTGWADNSSLKWGASTIGTRGFKGKQWVLAFLTQEYIPSDKVVEMWRYLDSK